MTLPPWPCFHSPSLVACMWQQWHLTLASPPLAVAYAGCVCGEEAPSGLAGLGVHLCLSSWVCVPEKRPACPVGASVGKTGPLRQPCRRGAGLQGSGVRATALPGGEAFLLGRGRNCQWASVLLGRGWVFQAGVPWLMAFQQRVSAGFSLWRKETAVGREKGRCSLVEVEL